MSKDLLHALRMLRQNPGFTLIAILCFGLGIGVNTAVFGLLNYVFLRPLPVPHPEQMVQIYRPAAVTISFPDYRDFRDRSDVFEGVAATNITESSLDFNGRAELAAAETVSINFGEVMGVPPALGRWFRPEEDRLTTNLPAVISKGAWQRLFGADPGVIGKRVRSETQWYTIVGVAPKSFSGTFLHLPTDLWVPIQAWARQYENQAARIEDRNASMVITIARLKRGISLAQARARLDIIDQQLRREYPRTEARQTARAMVDRARGATGTGRTAAVPIITLAMSVVGLVLLIACVNIANLLLARAASRQKEIAIRFALGASRSRIMRQMLTESGLLALFGGILGFGFGVVTNRLLPLAMPEPIDLSPDYRVLAFTLLVTVAATIVVTQAFVPVLWKHRVNPFTITFGRARLRRLSVIAQVAISLVLLFVSTVFLRTLAAFHSADPGFRFDGRLFAQVYISPPEYTSVTGPAFYRRLVDHVRTLPQVRDAGLTSMLPLSYPISTCAAIDGPGQRTAILRPSASAIDGGFASTVGIRQLEGRTFRPADGPGAPPVVMINETMTRTHWPGQSPLGQRIRIGNGCESGRGTVAEIVGVLADSRYTTLLQAPEPHVYQPLAQNYGGLTTLVVDTGDESNARAEQLRRQLLDFEPSLRVYAIKPLREHVAHSYWQARFEAYLLAGFGALALVLAAVGLYGVIAYATAQRTHEIGIRMAIGARAREVIRMIVAQALGLTGIGIAFGLALSLAAARPLKALAYGLNPADPVTLLSVAITWITVAALASYIPARRAAQIDPMQVLRYE